MRKNGLKWQPSLLTLHSTNNNDFSPNNNIKKIYKFASAIKCFPVISSSKFEQVFFYVFFRENHLTLLKEIYSYKEKNRF